MKSGKFYLVNGITSVRIVAFPFLLLFIYRNEPDSFKWLLGVCFLTDMIDGFLARRLNVASEFGTRMDSIGDDLTIVVSSGDVVAMASDNNANITVSSTLNGLTESSVTKTSTAYTGSLTNGTGADQTAVYTITSASDATAKVTAEGLLGSRFITLEQGGSDTKLADGGVISNTQGAVDIWSLISQAMFEKETGGGTANP